VKSDYWCFYIFLVSLSQSLQHTLPESLVCHDTPHIFSIALINQWAAVSSCIGYWLLLGLLQCLYNIFCSSSMISSHHSNVECDWICADSMVLSCIVLEYTCILNAVMQHNMCSLIVNVSERIGQVWPYDKSHYFNSL